MHIAIYLADQHPHRDRSLGITVYTSALIRHLREVPGIALTPVRSRSSYSPEASPGEVRECVIPFRTDTLFTRVAADQLHPLLCRPPVDLWHYPKGFLPLLGTPKRPIVGTVADVILQHYADRYPDERSSTEYQYWLAMLKRSIGRFDAVLTVSNFSKRAIEAFCDRYQIRCPPIVVTYNGCDWESFDPAPAEKKPVLLHFASPQLHKRTRSVIDFWRCFEQQTPGRLTLNLIGDLNPTDAAAAHGLKTATISPRLPREEIKHRLAEASALILASEIEGFGLPAIESYAAGTPVVYVKETAVEEVIGDGTPGGFYLDSYASFAEAINAVIKMEPQAVASKRAELAQKFRWEQCAEQTIAAYASILGAAQQ